MTTGDLFVLSATLMSWFTGLLMGAYGMAYIVKGAKRK